MSDTFASHMPSLVSPASHAFAITPSDASDLPQVTRAINVEVSGLVNILTPSGATVDLFVAAGIAFPMRAVRVLASGTTATGIRGLT